MKLYLVWNEAKTECVGFVDEKAANYAAGNDWDHNTMDFTDIGDDWLSRYGHESRTITEIEV